jgi:EAL domain-containing protein (putative c-di-GMP-specific phosphodiesterase class I)
VLAALEKPLTARRLGEVLRGYTRLRSDADTPADTVAVGGEALRAAVESGAFTTQFEPRIDLASGAVSSAEAGSRWYGAEGDPVPGSTLALMLEREHLTTPFVEQLVAASCAMVDEAAAAGLDADAPLRVAVNVSLLPLGEPSIADRLTAMVLSHGEHPRRFVWEVDDVALARASVAMVQVLTRLRVKGFGLSMSNCGLGTAWTNHVERVPLSELKLDRRLVDGVSGDAKRLSALESALASAREFGLAVVADGCDSRDDFDALLALGCSEAQGRFVAEPMPGVDLVAWAMAGYAPDDSVSTK